MDRDPGAAVSCVVVNKPLAFVNRVLMGIHVVLATAAIAHRLLHLRSSASSNMVMLVTAMVMVAADVTLLFIWALSQAAMWRPVTRAAFPERLRRRREEEEQELPGLDVLVVTADPEKEPVVEVMNTVLSAMALDYPSITVYLSDDAGSPLMLLAARKARAFATTAWLPFCKKYNLKCPCPSIYFSKSFSDDDDAEDDERLTIKKMYESLTADLLEEEAKKKQSKSQSDREDHDAYVEIISEGNKDDAMMPKLVYVSREKRKTYPHHFKAGALNVLLRVSSLVSNSAYVLVLDCDMKCNSRSSAMEAMCFHLDQESNKHLAFVQFPQMFHNLSPNDIYANELRPIFATRWKGLDGLRGPILSGTGFYARRDALYGATPSGGTMDKLDDDSSRLGRSKDLAVPHEPTKLQPQPRMNKPPPAPASLLKKVASCAYEEETGWGHQVGFLYQSVVEDYFTGYRQLFCRGWTSVYCYPSTPAFLGSVPTNLNDVLVQNKRWMSGMLAVGFSRRYCPLLSRESLSISVLQTMAFAYYAFISLSAFPLLCYAILVPISAFKGATAFLIPSPGPSLAVAAFVSSNLQHLIEVSVAKQHLALRTWWNEQRFWMLNAVTAQLFACVTVFLNLVGAGTIDFDLTNKASDEQLYHKGVFDFTGCSTLLLPATTLTLLNLAGLLAAIITADAASSLLLLQPHLLLMCYVAALSYPLLEGMFLRHDSARVPPRITALSVAIAAALLAMFAS